MQDKKHGLMGGLKRILFHEEGPQAPGATAAPRPAPAQAPLPPPPAPDRGSTDRIRQVLDKMNRPGVDFMEVWKAAAEMGGATPQNLRAAFTSLRFADQTLDKRKVLDTGAGYVASLRDALSSESRKRADELLALESERDQKKLQLDLEIQAIADEVESLTRQLHAKKAERDGLHDHYAARIAEIDSKIRSGQASVDAVVAEMEDVLRSVEEGIP